MTKNLSLLGSTGSIGTQSLDVARKRGYRVRALSAFSNVKKIEEQAMTEEKLDVIEVLDRRALFSNGRLRNRFANSNRTSRRWYPRTRQRI